MSKCQLALDTLYETEARPCSRAGGRPLPQNLTVSTQVDSPTEARGLQRSASTRPLASRCVARSARRTRRRLQCNSALSAARDQSRSPGPPPKRAPNAGRRRICRRYHLLRGHLAFARDAAHGRGHIRHDGSRHCDGLANTHAGTSRQPGSPATRGGAGARARYPELCAEPERLVAALVYSMSTPTSTLSAFDPVAVATEGGSPPKRPRSAPSSTSTRSLRWRTLPPKTSNSWPRPSHA